MRPTSLLVPRGAAWPLAVEVVAWRYGSGSEPRIRTAALVRRTILITP